MNIFYMIRNWFDNLLRKKPKTTVIITKPEKKFIIAGVPNRGKEEPHTKMRRKMEQRSRRINRLYADRKGG